MKTSRPSVSYPPLPKVYKGFYPFGISVPSFVYPDTWTVNAEMLGPYVDEIELLFFESHGKDVLPKREQIRILGRIAADTGLNYNVHLPTDIFLAASDKMKQITAVDAIRRIVDLASGLAPSTWTLHLPYKVPGCEPEDVETWRMNARKGLEMLLGVGILPRTLSIENLDYPFSWIRDFINDYDFSICMDVGHLLSRGEAIEDFYRSNTARISHMHLHGSAGGKDHQPLTVLSPVEGMAVANIIRKFEGTISLEVFSYDYLASSLEWLEKAVNNGA